MPPEPLAFVKLRSFNWLLVAGWLWGILCVLLLVRAYCMPKKQTVTHNYTDAGQHWLAGTDAYELKFKKSGEVDPRMSGFRYSPLCAAFFAPISLLSDAWSSVLWRLFSYVTYLAVLALFFREVIPGTQLLSTNQRGAWWLLLLPLSLPSMNNGQANVLMLTFMLAAAVAVMRERWNLAALALAGAFYLKLYPLAVTMLFLVVYPRQLSWRLGLAMLAGLLLPFAMQHPAYVSEQYWHWFLLLTTDDRTLFPMTQAYRDFYLLTRWVGLPPAQPLYMMMQLMTGSAVAAVLLLGRISGWPKKHLVHSLILLGCCWLIVFGPSTESCTYILLAPGMAWALVDAFVFKRSNWTRAIQAVVFGLCMITSICNWFPDARMREWTFPLLPMASLLFFAERCYHVCVFWDRETTAVEDNQRPERSLAA